MLRLKEKKEQSWETYITGKVFDCLMADQSRENYF